MRIGILLLGLLLILGSASGLCAETSSTTTGTQAGQPESARHGGRVAVPEASEKALSYYRTRVTLWLIGTLWAIAVPALLLFTGASARIRDLALRVGRKRYFVIAIYVVVYASIVFAAQAPLAFYGGFVVEHEFGLSNQTMSKWIYDASMSLLVLLVTGVALLWVPYALLRRSPRRWWFYTGLLLIPFLFFVELVAPLWVEPLFNKFGPMQNRALESKILDLAGRAGIEGGRVFEVAKSEDTKQLNAYVTGFLQTKRIVLWDTLLAKFNERETLCVMGHEMGHYALGHIWKGIVFLALLLMLVLYLVHRTAHWMIARYWRSFRFTDLSDVASLPLLVSLGSVLVFLLGPIGLAYSRAMERQADQFGLEITRDNFACASAFAHFVSDDLANPRPGFLVHLLRGSHPTPAERIEFANDYRPWADNKPLRFERLFKPGQVN